MTPSRNLTALVCSFESCVLTAYWDGTYIDAPSNTVKRWSVGWGSTRHDGALVQEGDACTQEQADTWRDNDMAVFSVSVNVDLAPVISLWDADPALYQDKFDSLCDFSYNAGPGNLKSSTLLRLVIAELSSAADEFQRWTLAGGKRSNGLLRRRLAERALYLSDFRPDGSLKTERSDFPDAQWYPG